MEVNKLKFYCEDSDKVLAEVKSTRDGLSSEEAAKRLDQNGKNKLVAAKGKSIIRRFFEQLADPMTIILLVAAAISGGLAAYESITHPGEGEGFADVIIILIVVIVNAVLGVYQESKAEKAIEALQEMSAATSKVLRDGKVQIIRSEDLVVGDVILLEAGDSVPADARILENASLKVEEAALTGESVPVTKFIDTIYLKEGERDVALGDRKNMLYMGSTVVYGRGVAVITGTGMDTEMGKIAGALQDAEEGDTPLQRKLHQLSKILTWLVLGICVVVFGVQLIRAGNFSFANTVLPSFMVAVSLAVAAIPEGLAAVVTVVLSIGVTNMSKRNAIIRRLTAVETLGCAQIICSDKTGTLTQNKMTVVDHFGENEGEIARAMALCCDAEIDTDGNVTGEPTEAALVNWANKLGMKKYDLKNEYPRSGEAPFDPEIADKPDAAELENVKGNISIKNVSFSYSPAAEGGEAPAVLNNINVEIPAGSCFAVVGPSGGGKTTLCHLIPRFYDVTEGSISIDGLDIRDVTQKSLRRSIGIVQQDVFMFAGTIRDNIAYGNPDASFEEIMEAAKRAEIHNEIMEMPDGYDTYVGERGVMLSGGQKQRIA
ncbi:MAG: ATP-binding cassette domain-containing protein, partial [Ruminococcaceae bacterium]|nr:ATP-binding cassette domain-containing protein [Oscillospiraceae bacterium]